MKKYILLSLAFIMLCGSWSGLTFAQDTTSSSAQSTTSDSLDVVGRNIDRRLVYFNKYKQTGDIESISKLVSEENKNFYINFMKYVKTAPVFTLKRDTEARIIKTPTDDYMVTIIVAANNKEKKVSMTFIEEKSERGNKWLIADSDLHIQIPLPANSNLTSSALNTPKNTTTSPSTTPSSDTKKEDTKKTETTSQPVATMPVINKATAPIAASTPVPTIQRQTPTTNYLFVAIIISLVLGGCGLGVWYGLKKRKNKKAAVLAASVAATAVVTEVLPSNTETPPISNVTISTVEELQKIPETTSPDVSIPAEKVASVANTETIPVDVQQSPENTAPSETTPPTDTQEPVTENITPNTETPPVTPQPAEELLPAAGNLIASPEGETPTTVSTPEEMPSSQEPSPAIVSDSTPPEELVEKHNETIQNISSPESTEEVVEKTEEPLSSSPIPQGPLSLDQIIAESKETDNKQTNTSGEKTPHSLFDSIFNPEPAKPESHGLFGDILESSH